MIRSRSPTALRPRWRHDAPARRSRRRAWRSLKAEIAELEGPVRVALSKKIKDAREEGDLSENAEYHALKDEQGHMETKILRLTERLRNAVVVEATPDTTVVAFGSTVSVTDLESGREQKFTLVGPTEADVKSGSSHRSHRSRER